MPSHIVREVGGGPGKTLLFDITCELTHRVQLAKMVELDGDIYPCLATLMVATLARAGKTLVMPEGTQIMMITREAFNNVLLEEASCNYDSYGLVNM